MPNVAIILVSPQMGENIGACARAMKNFGLYDLRIVSPRDGWPNAKAEANAALAADVIQNAKIYSNLPDAISDLHYLYATTAQVRRMNKDYVTTKNLSVKFPQNQKVGIMFGRENNGLTNEEIALANEIIVVDTNPDCSSLNIAQAVLLVCYELFEANKRADLVNNQELCTKNEMSYFIDHLVRALDDISFFKPEEKRNYMVQNITNIFTRIEKLSHNEIQTLRGIVSSFSKTR